MPDTVLTIEAGRLQFFAKATGQTDPVYLDREAAEAAGHPDLPVPPTFLAAIELAQPDPFAFLADLGVDLRSVLHGEQAFTYYSTAYAGDTLVAKTRIADVYTKKGGALEFIVKVTEISKDDGTAVAEMTNVVVIRNLPGSK
ncbi:MaoC family dehydratase N-terminal domain-containing protein [Mycolicibacterium sp. CAU 1645]|uniref:MaoC family dehydratase N-terminal domain-containing protein n=2 Tax=Mycolicibacterium arenosum TaxID=2952157 RepID=A0ABT1LYN8_9MYCO|nr:MaoC family dehydratase N-terminal domain-containing protein [Mycolicibacterium sp. CAU 1645]MCP9271154.1 MaoC family dehydratase N-terminal domain-containing protein [Mycolicibacterium sp. CAU 1645]